ncbi:MAG: peptidase, partial [Salinisphaera sp.]|nr:peptidase [Salinisphaera sp.]
YGRISLGDDAMPWLDDGQAANKLLTPGAIVRLAYTGEKKRPWVLAQIPAAQGALVALDPHTGAIQALVGGFEFDLSQFNRATQAYRQPGSSFKPFVYSAALANGFTPATIVNDAPVVFGAPGLGNDWRPQNYSGSIHGPTRMRLGLVHSRNLMTIRILHRVGVATAINYIDDFGLPANRMPHDLSLALGSATFTPLMMARADAVFANGGYLVNPYFIAEIRNDAGEVVYQPTVLTACTRECTEQEQPYAPRVITPQNAWLMVGMMHDVIRHGTGRAATRIGRHDLAGKTGTTDEQRDAWFTGYNQALVTVCWVGFDHMKPLGFGETGAHAALPMWIDFMAAALEGVPETSLPRPSGLVTVRINPDTGLLAQPGEEGIFETFRVGHVPPPPAPGSASGDSQRGHLF